ncbi:septum formation initiator family protein [Nocardiopsis sp. RSe5-2]|uniref:Septum formation initiator family protein n=1 Tax=Nocardiopsis endophytica TaxID=3018445 RepID=A0ABT4U2V1_9ACTN|nr:septum formation initiator family protein [Nocardiopsis endophytica]MDA2811255.1 septum formation initiator family protein [Nocardiopsis endophytica]
MPKEPEKPKRPSSARGGGPRRAEDGRGPRSAGGASARGAPTTGPRASGARGRPADAPGRPSAGRDPSKDGAKKEGAKKASAKGAPAGSTAKSAAKGTAKSTAKGAKTAKASTGGGGTAGKAGNGKGGSGKGSGSGGRRGLRPALTSRAAILALVVCAIALSLAYPLREYVAQRSEIAQLQDELAERKEGVEDLQERREQLRDPDHIEREARTRLHYQYPGEQAYVVVSGDDPEYGEQGGEGPEDPWFTKLWKSVEAADDPGAGRERIPDAQPPGR